jgi:hypothetical protein
MMLMLEYKKKTEAFIPVAFCKIERLSRKPKTCLTKRKMTSFPIRKMKVYALNN